MDVVKELNKSVKAFNKIIDEFDTIDNITDFDAYEVRAQKVVFELQMKANQVAREFAPALRNKRFELQNANAIKVMERFQAQVEAAKTADEVVEDESVEDSKPEETEDKPEADPKTEEKPEETEDKPEADPKTEEKPEEVKEDGGNDSGQPASDAGNSKSESDKKTK